MSDCLSDPQKNSNVTDFWVSNCWKVVSLVSSVEISTALLLRVNLPFLFYLPTNRKGSWKRKRRGGAQMEGLGVSVLSSMNC